MSKTVCVVAAQRTGSNLLMHGLPESFVNFGEVFNKRHFPAGLFARAGMNAEELRGLARSNPRRLVQIMMECPQADGRHAVFKCQYQNLFGAEEPWRRELAAAIEEDTRIHIVHLFRRNLMHRYISKVMAETTGQYWQRKSATDDPPAPLLHIRPWRCIRDMERIAEQMRQVETTLYRPPFMQISYEELCEDWEGCIVALSQFLGVDLSSAAPRTRKQIADYRAVVENYDELERKVTRRLGTQLGRITSSAA